jgi:hypothetical protein
LGWGGKVDGEGWGLNFGGGIEIITKFSALYPKDKITASLMFSAGKNIGVMTSRTGIFECEYCKRFLVAKNS